MILFMLRDDWKSFVEEELKRYTRNEAGGQKEAPPPFNAQTFEPRCEEALVDLTRCCLYHEQWLKLRQKVLDSARPGTDLNAFS